VYSRLTQLTQAHSRQEGVSRKYSRMKHTTNVNGPILRIYTYLKKVLFYTFKKNNSFLLN